MSNGEAAGGFSGFKKSMTRSLAGVSEDLPHIFDAHLDHLEADPEQPRETFHDESIEELAQSIESQGLIQPIVVREHPEKEHSYFIVAGERRYRAFLLLKRKSIPAILTSGNHREITLVENIQREDLDPIEEAKGYKALQDSFSYNQNELAKAVGKKRNTVNEILRINTLPDYIKEGCRTYDTPIPKRVLIDLARITDKEEQRSLWNKLTAGKADKITVRGARERKKESSSDSKPAAPVTKVISAAKALASRIEEISPAEIKEDSEAREKLLSMEIQIVNFFNEIR